MSVVAAQRERAFGMITELEPESFKKAISYISYLRTMEEIEEMEDIALFDARKDEPTVPLSQIIENYEKKYGSFN